LKKTDKTDDYVLVSNIYVKEKKFDTALKYLESAYIKNYNEQILDRMAIILYVNLDRKKDAIAQLETHSRMNGCSELICKRLIGFYSNENNIDGLLSVYLRYYNMLKKPEIADKIVQIYAYKKEYIKMIDFLENSEVDDALLLELYASMKNYHKASVLASKLYDETGDINYLGQSAIFEYEGSKNKNNTKMQKRVIKKLQKVLKETRSAMYLNYLGYLLIDHEIDVKKGISYIKDALKYEPESAYYLDSLAWGYYKLGLCDRAKKLITKVSKMKGGDDKEVVFHMKLINKCKKGKE
jgi:tetratricopeptide (TPR) repeat protein